MIIYFIFVILRMQTQSPSSTELLAVTAFDEINKRAKSQPTLVKKVGAVIVFDITKNGKVQQSWSQYFD